MSAEYFNGVKANVNAATKNAIWFFDKNGEMDGPFTPDEILKLVMDGAIKVEGQIYNVETNAWSIAADIIPHVSPTQPAAIAKKFDEQIATSAMSSFNASNAVAASVTGWQPPPKPQDLKDYHVVDVTSEESQFIDYFALVSSNKKNSNAASSTSKQSDMHMRGESMPHVKERSLSLGEEIAEATSYLKSYTNMLGKWQRPLIYSAAFAFIFSGTFGLLKNYNKNKNREPATNQETAQARNVAPAAQSPAPDQSIRMQSSSTLGSGQNRAARDSGSVSMRGIVPQPQQARVEAAPEPPRPEDRNHDAPARDTSQEGSAQFYSSSDDTSRDVAGASPQVQVPDAAMPPQMDPAVNGAVNPPGFVDGQAADPNVPTPSTF